MLSLYSVITNHVFTSLTIEDFEERLKEAVQSAISPADVKKEDNSETVFLTRKEAAKLLRISLPTLSRYVKDGVIPAQMLGNEYRFDKAKLVASLEDIQAYKYKGGRS